MPTLMEEVKQLSSEKLQETSLETSSEPKKLEGFKPFMPQNKRLKASYLDPKNII